MTSLSGRGIETSWDSGLGMGAGSQLGGEPMGGECQWRSEEPVRKTRRGVGLRGFFLGRIRGDDRPLLEKEPFEEGLERVGGEATPRGGGPWVTGVALAETNPEKEGGKGTFRNDEAGVRVGRSGEK